MRSRQAIGVSTVIALVLATTACDRLLEPLDLPDPGASSTPDIMPTATSEPQPTDTPTPGPVSTVSPTPSATPTETPTPTPTPAQTPTPEPPPEPSATPAFFYYPPGELEPNSGQGHPDDTIYVPDMVFPIKDAPAFPQSQVYRYGGGLGPGPDQCDARNFSYPWRDNYCEKRSNSNSTPYCPTSKIHLGQDIRVGTPAGCRSEVGTASVDRKRYAVVAAADGMISNIGRYTVNVNTGGRIYRYMHMNMQALEVELGQDIKAGDVLGYVSNDFGGTPTTLHLHFEIKHNTSEHGWTWAPPFTSLIAAYERREGGKGEAVDINGDGE